MKKYTIVEDGYINKLCEKVEALLNNGWQLVGGVSTRSGGVQSARTYTQALVKEEQQ